MLLSIFMGIAIVLVSCPDQRCGLGTRLPLCSMVDGRGSTVAMAICDGLAF